MYLQFLHLATIAIATINCCCMERSCIKTIQNFEFHRKTAVIGEIMAMCVFACLYNMKSVLICPGVQLYPKLSFPLPHPFRMQIPTCQTLEIVKCITETSLNVCMCVCIPTYTETLSKHHHMFLIEHLFMLLSVFQVL